MHFELRTTLRIHTGSHPVTAVNPFVPQPGLLPDVMSLKTDDAALLYKSGFSHPSVDLPALSSWSLTSATRLANVGLDALVPPMRNRVPATLTMKFVPCMETSGKPRPDALYRPE